MTDEIPKLELTIERFFIRLWKGVISIEKYLTTKPKNKMELWDKHTLIIEILSFVLFGWSIIRQIWR